MLVAIWLLLFVAAIFAVRDWTDVKISVALAAVVCVSGDRSRLISAIGGILSGHIVLGAFLDVHGWSLAAWFALGAMSSVQVICMVQLLASIFPQPESEQSISRLPSKRLLLFVLGTAGVAILGGAAESLVLRLFDARGSSSGVDLAFGMAIAACLAAIALTRRGSAWLASTRPPGSELLAPLLVLLVTLVGIQVTRQIWSQRDDDSWDVQARSIAATVQAMWDREVGVLDSTARLIAPSLAFDASVFDDLVLPYLDDDEFAVGAALSTSSESTDPAGPEIVASLDDGSLPGVATIPKGFWSGVSEEAVGYVGAERYPLLVERIELVPLPDGGRLELMVAFSLPELMRSSAVDVLGGLDDVAVAASIADGDTSSEIWIEGDAPGAAQGGDGRTIAAGTLSVGERTVDLALVPSGSPGQPWGPVLLAVGAESAVGILLCGVLILGANAQFKMDQERRRRENLLEAALDATPGVSVVFGSDFRVLAANKPVRQEFGAEVSGLEVARIFGLESDLGRRRLVEEALAKALQGEPTQVEIAEDFDPDQGSHVPNRMRILELSAYPVVSPGGEPVGFLHAVDATERRSLAMRSAQSERMESLGALAGGLAHDFNNLLFVTLGNLQLMAMNETVTGDEKLSKFVSRSMSAVERGAEITKSLLAVARSEPLEESAVSLADLVKGILPLVRQALGSGRRVEVDLPESNLQLMVDSGRLSSCILNLAFNSRDAMGPNGTLRISASLDAETEMIQLSVSDDGAGMPPDVVARAFEPFFTTKRPGSGTGLGLATVYAFAKQSGGTAYLESRPGSGTTVTLVLPQFTGQTKDRSVVASRRSGRRVVVADDEQSLAEMVAAWLIDMGIDARFATSPKAALELIEEFEPDVLVSDANFGEELDGIELARLGTAIVPDMAVVFMTGYSTSMRELQELGERTMAKPFSREDLYAVLSPLIAEEIPSPGNATTNADTSRKKGRSS